MAKPNIDNYDEGYFDDETELSKATLVEHLEDLRLTIFRSLIFLAIGWVVGWIIEPQVYELFRQLITDPEVTRGVEVREVFSHFTAPFFLKLKLSFVIGLILAGPLILIQFWKFVKPALKKNERSLITRITPISAILFCIGVFFGYLIMKPALTWFISFVQHFPGTALLQDPGTFVVFILKMLVAFGLGFQLPVVLWILAKLGLLTSDGLWKNWRIAVVAIVVSAAILTPSGDAFSLAMMSAPLALLYFTSIFVIRYGEKRKKKREDEYDFE